MHHHPLNRREEIIHQLGRIDRRLQRLAFFIIARIPADAGQPIRGQRQKSGLGQTPGDILDIGVQAAVLMYHHHGGQFSHRSRGLHQIASHIAIAVGRGVGDVIGDNIGVVEADLLGQSIIRRHDAQKRRRRQSADGKLRRLIKKLAF